MNKLVTLSFGAALLCGCAAVDITKTGKGFFNPTNPNEVEILKTIPQRPYEEIATVSAIDFDANESAKMHNAIRAKAAPLGANAVVLSDERIWPNGKRWATGVAVRYKDLKN